MQRHFTISSARSGLGISLHRHRKRERKGEDSLDPIYHNFQAACELAFLGVGNRVLVIQCKESYYC